MRSWRTTMEMVGALACILIGWFTVSASGVELTSEQKRAMHNVNAVKLVVTENYGLARNLSFPKITNISTEMLKAAGVEVVTDDTGTSTAILLVRVQGTPLSGLYGSSDNHLYTGAIVQGSISIVVSGRTLYSDDFGGKIDPPPGIYSSGEHMKDSAQAPFYKAIWAVTEGPYSKLKPVDSDLLGVLSRMISSAWGVDQCVPLLHVFRNDYWPIRRRVAELLGMLKCAEAVPVLCKALNDENNSERLRAIFALGEIGGDRSIDPLIQFLKQAKYSEGRLYAAEVLRKLTGQKLGSTAEEWELWRQQGKLIPAENR